MTPSSPGVKLTYDDFVQFPDDGLRHELIDGEHYDALAKYKAPANIHPSHCAHRRLARTQPIGKLFHAPFDVVFSSTTL